MNEWKSCFFFFSRGFFFFSCDFRSNEKWNDIWPSDPLWNLAREKKTQKNCKKKEYNQIQHTLLKNRSYSVLRQIWNDWGMNFSWFVMLHGHYWQIKKMTHELFRVKKNGTLYQLYTFYFSCQPRKSPDACEISYQIGTKNEKY